MQCYQVIPYTLVIDLPNDPGCSGVRTAAPCVPVYERFTRFPPVNARGNEYGVQDLSTSVVIVMQPQPTLPNIPSRRAFMTKISTLLLAACCPIGAANLASQPRAVIPIRELVTDAKSEDSFGSVHVRALPDGRIMVNDAAHRQLLIFDSHFENRWVVLDSAGSRGHVYPQNGGRLISHLADSSFLVDPTSQSLLVISPTGTISRVAAVPNTNHLNFVSGLSTGVDANGNLVYVGDAILPPQPAAPRKLFEQTGYLAPIDSAPILRANFETRTVDTVARVKIPTVNQARLSDKNGEITQYILRHPVAVLDEMAVLANGTIAVVRNHDYHVDFISTDGKIASSPKLPFDWRVFSDAEKQAKIDSAKIVLAHQDSMTRARAAAAGPPAPGSLEARIRAASAAASATAYKPTVRVNEFVALDAMPGFWPSIRAGAAKADLDNNLWILPTTTAQSKSGELVYDVVNSRGALFQRVRLPLGRAIAGFGRDGVVFLSVKDSTVQGPNGFRLEKTRISR